MKLFALNRRDNEFINNLGESNYNVVQVKVSLAKTNLTTN